MPPKTVIKQLNRPNVTDVDGVTANRRGDSSTSGVGWLVKKQHQKLMDIYQVFCLLYCK